MLKFLSSLLIALLFPSAVLAYDYSSDCINFMPAGVTVSTVATNTKYVGRDDIGIVVACRNQFPSWGEKFTVSRIGTSFDNLQYRVERKYCTARDGFAGWSCFWWAPSGWYNEWGDTYAATINGTDITNVGVDGGSGKLVLKGGLNNPGYHTCLKRVPDGYNYPQGGTNTTKKSQVCAYVINALADFSNACNDKTGSPYGLTWDAAYIGCVDEPGPPGPPVFNTTIPAASAPFVVPMGLHKGVDPAGNPVDGLIDNYNSTFAQPVVVLQSSQSTERLTLRYVFAGDKAIDSYPQCAKFTLTTKAGTPSPINSTDYCAMVPPDNPSQVCGCDKVGCTKGAYLGCVPRPAPQDSGYAIVGDFNPFIDTTTNKIITPAMNVLFVATNADGTIAYVDANAQKVYFDTNNNPMLLDSSGNKTTTPAKLPLAYAAVGKNPSPLVLPNPKLQIREFYSKQVGNDPSGNPWLKNLTETQSVYGLQFSAMIPNVDSSGAPQYLSYLYPYNRAKSDGCNAITLNPDQNDPTSLILYSPAGGRDRTNCKAISGLNPASYPVPNPYPCSDGQTCSCTTTGANCIPGTLKCADSTVMFTEKEAAKAYCPGLITGSSDDNVGDYSGLTMCINLVGDWPPPSASNKLCTVIPQSCDVINNQTRASGYLKWAKALKPSEQDIVTNTCASTLGNAYTNALSYTLTPSQPVAQSSIDCTKLPTGTNCQDAYNQYVTLIANIAQQLKAMQSTADMMGRNLYAGELEKLNALINSTQNIGGNKIVPATLNPTRSCDAFNTSKIANACKIADSCANILNNGVATDSLSYGKAYTGYAAWDSTTLLNDAKTNITKLLSSSEQTMNSAKQYFVKDVVVAGTCDGTVYVQSPSGAPSRTCHLVFNGGKYVSSAWDATITNPCVPK